MRLAMAAVVVTMTVGAMVVVVARAHAAAVAATARVDAERTVDGADGPADRTTDDAPDRAADAVALGRAAAHAARQALGIGGHRHGEGGQGEARREGEVLQIRFYGLPFRGSIGFVGAQCARNSGIGHDAIMDWVSPPKIHCRMGPCR